MDAKISKFFDSVNTFFTGADSIPSCDSDIVVVVFTLGQKNKGFICDQIGHVAATWEGKAKEKGGRSNLGCEREVAEAEKDGSDERKSECLLRLSWALVHSKRSEDVQRGIAMLEGSLANTSSPLEMREKMYLLGVGYYRSGDYTRSRQLVDRCLEIAPDWRQAITLKKAIEDRIKKDGVIGIGIAATAVGLVAGGLAAALSRKK